MASGDKFCWSCGSSLLAKDMFCRECGADLRKDEPVAEDAQEKLASDRGRKPRAVKTTPDAVSDVPQSSMDFGESIQLGFQHYADFSGRATRPEFWWQFLFTALGGSAVGFVDYLLSGGIVLVIMGDAILIAFWLLFLLTTLSVTARRLRDANHSPWWSLIPYVAIILCTQKSAGVSPTQESNQSFHKK